MRSTDPTRPARPRSLLRARPTLYGGRRRSQDRGLAPGEIPYGFPVAEGLAAGTRPVRRATGRNPSTVRAENRRRNRAARASRKANR